jgi:hypothetical protein
MSDLEEITTSEEVELQLTDKEIFTRIWTDPRSVFKYLHENQYDKYVNLLLVLAGISKTFDRASSKNMGDTLPLIAVIGLCIILGGLVGWISTYIYAALLSWTGKWLNGKGNTVSLLRMMAHAMIPSIAALLMLIPQIGLFGNSIFQSEIDISVYGYISVGIFYFSLFIELSLTIYTLCLLVIGISEVQKLSIGKSILNLLLPGLTVLVPLALIAFLLGDYFG